MADEFTRGALTAEYPVNRPIFYKSEVPVFTGVAGQQVSASIQAKERTVFLCTGLYLEQCNNPANALATDVIQAPNVIAPLRLTHITQAFSYDLSNNQLPTLSQAFGGKLNASFEWPGYIALKGLEILRADITNNFVGSVTYSLTFYGIEYTTGRL